MVLTINMEVGLITPPVGLNLFVIQGIAPDVELTRIIYGVIPFIMTMLGGILLLCFLPGMVTWLPDLLLGPVK